MRKKNLILLTSITGLLLTLTPSQALAQESTTPTTSQSSSDKNTDNKDENKKLPTDEKCHWKGETPVPENKYLKLLYDENYKLKNYNDDDGRITYDEMVDKIKNGDYPNPKLKELVANGEMTENEAIYRELLRFNIYNNWLFYWDLYYDGLYPPHPDTIKNIINEVYDNPDNADEMVKEVMDSYSLKEYLEYVNNLVDPNKHIYFSDKETYDKYQKEFEELDKVIDYDKNDKRFYWADSSKFKVVKLLDSFDSEEEQIDRFIKLHYWLEYFPTKDKIDFNNYKAGYDLSSVSLFAIRDYPELLKILKEKGLDNDEFYNKAKEYYKENDYKDKDNSSLLFKFLREEYDIDWRTGSSGKGYRVVYETLYPLLDDPHFEIPRDFVCDDEEEPEESTTPTTSTVEDKTETPTTTPTTTNKKKPNTKTTSKEKSTTSKEKPEEPIKEDEETNNTTPEKPIEKENNSNKTPNTINNPNTKPVQSGFTPVNNTKPGTFNGGVSSTVEGEKISEGGTVDTGSPTTSILNKIRTIF